MLDVAGVSHSFGHKKVLSNISFRIEKGSVLGLVGVNGAGKTTIIRLAVGLIKLSEGTIRVDGYSLEDNPREYQSKIGAVLEGKQNLYPRMSVLENLKYFACLRKMKKCNIKDRIEELESDLAIKAFMNKEVYALSNGMQQKAAIACSLIHEPELIFLDEPTLGLDYEAANLIHQYLLKLRKKGKSILITSHDFNFLNNVVDSALFLEDGQIRCIQNFKDIDLENERVNYKVVISGVHHFDHDCIISKQITDNYTELILECDKNTGLSDILRIFSDEKVISLEKKETTIKDIYLNMIGEQKNAK